MARKKRGRGVDATGRSVGEGKHVRLYEWMLGSAAYRSLGVAPRALLIELMRLHNGGNNGQLVLGVRTAAELLGVKSKDTATKALTELIERGFVRQNLKGTFDLKLKHATTWILTEYPHGTQPATKDFMRWQPPTENQKPVLKSRTDSPKNQDRSVLENGTVGPKNQDREGTSDGSVGPKNQDTTSLPSEAGLHRDASSATQPA